jgi:hypothetical protein
MALRRLAGGCEDVKSCPGVWQDDENQDNVIIVGRDLDVAPIPVGAGESAVTLRWQIIREAVMGAQR